MRALILFGIAFAVLTAWGRDEPGPKASAEPEPTVEKAPARASFAEQKAAVPQNPLKDAYFGDTHLHTGVSMDAFIAGNRLTPDNAQ